MYKFVCSPCLKPIKLSNLSHICISLSISRSEVEHDASDPTEPASVSHRLLEVPGSRGRLHRPGPGPPADAEGPGDRGGPGRLAGLVLQQDEGAALFEGCGLRV